MLFDLTAADRPLIISIPHAGTWLPEEVEAGLTASARALPDTDWHVDQLFSFARDGRASVLAARASRYVVDLNRPPDDKPLYPGAGTGLVPRTRFDQTPLYTHDGPDDTAVARRLERYWQPYHRQLRALLDAAVQRHGHAMLLDGHSILSRVPALFEGRLPDLNLGTNEGRSCDPALTARAWSVLEAATDFTAVCDGRFKGGYITRHYGRPADNVHAVQLEIAQACYMDESRPAVFDAARAGRLTAVLRELVDVLSRWRPQ